MVAGALFTAFEFSVVQNAADINPTFQADFWGESAGSKDVKVSMLRVVGPTMLALGFIMTIASFFLCFLAYRGSQKVHYPPTNYAPVELREAEDPYVRRNAPRQYQPRMESEPLQTKDNMNITTSTTPPTTETPQGSPFSTRKQAESTTDTSYPPHDTSYPPHGGPDTPPQGSPYAPRKGGSMSYSESDDEFDYTRPHRKEIGV